MKRYAIVMLKVVKSQIVFSSYLKKDHEINFFTQAGKVDGQQFRVFFVKMGWYENENTI